MSIIRTPVYPWMTNESGIIKAGHVLKLIDIVGSEAPLKFLRDKKSPYVVVTASVDRTDFKTPIKAWEMLRLEARVTQAWKSSLESQVNIYADHIITGESRPVATSHLVWVAIDPKTRQKATSLPEFIPESVEEKQLAKLADLRKANRTNEGRVAPFISIDSQNDNPVTVDRVMTRNDANGQGNVFGGIILDIMDEVGSKAAQQQTLGEPVIGVRLDRMSFIAPTFIGERVEAKAIVTKTWGTSMEVQVEVEAVNPITNDRRQVASSYLVYVRLSQNGRPTQVPPFEPKTELQIKRAEAADVRRNIRKEEELVLESPQTETEPDKKFLAGFRRWLKSKL